MNTTIICPQQYEINQLGQCVHYLFPISIQNIIGSIFIAIIAGLSSMAGLGGGGPSLVIFILFFNYIPKQANMIVFTSILGATIGNTLNQMTKSHNKQPIIKYRYAFVSLPIMFIGSYMGVYLNALLPSIVICGIIVYTSSTSLPKIYERFKLSYQKQTKQLILQKQLLKKQDIIKQQIINPLNNKQNIYIFKNLLTLMIIFTVLLFIRGTQKVPSIFAIQPCSIMYWIIQIISVFVVICFAKHNLSKLLEWDSESNQNNIELKQVNQQNIQNHHSNNSNNKIQSNMNKIQPSVKNTEPYMNPIQKNIKQIIYQSILGGIFSGFGLGGGLFLIPMYRNLGCQPLQATASTAFTIVITAMINCIQGIFLGIIKLSDFVFFLTIAGGGSYIISVFLSTYLRKQNRLSYVQGLLLILLILAVINIPVSLLLKYINSGYDSKLILSFGSLC